MTKLRRVKKHINVIDLPECCRWCHYFFDGKCYNKNLAVDKKADVEMILYSLSEDGHLSATIEEVLGSIKLTPFKELENKLYEWGVSQKRVKEFNELFEKCYIEFSHNLNEELDEKVSMCYVNKIGMTSDFDGIEIPNPEEFVCKDWC